jgi:pSer/pThr/pTyr-binding forkhead associated (FHA) protein
VARDRKRERPPLRLVVVDPVPLQGRTYDLSAGPVTIGRDAHCTIALDDNYVSQRHASVTATDGQITVDDLGSTNGTYVNGRRLTGPAVLRPGDRLQVGGATLELQ